MMADIADLPLRLALLGDLHWARPWAWLLATGPLWLAAWRRWNPGSEARAVAIWAEPAMRRWAVRPSHAPGGSWHWALEAALWLCVAATLAGPRQLLAVDAAGQARLEHRVDVLAVVEALPRDAAGAPLGPVRAALQDLQARLQGERLGLLEYARGAGLLLPPTRDMRLLGDAVNQLDPDLLAGTAGPGLPGALALAADALGRDAGPSRALLLAAGPGSTRGIDDAGRAALARQTAALARQRIPVEVLWTGADAIDPALRNLAAATGGRVARLDAPDPWSDLYDHAIARLPSNPAPRRGSFAWRELYALPLAGALLALLALEGAWPGSRRRGAAPLAALALLAWGGLHPTPASAAGAADDAGARQAWAAWTAHHDRAARALYAAMPGYAGRLGEGACDVRLGAYAQALEAFRAAVLLAPGDRERADALYDLGNAAFHVPGRLREAIDAYQASLVLRPGRAATLRNLGLAQAQWAQDHPEAAMVGMLKRRAASDISHFGDTSNTTPSQLGPQARAQRPQAEADQALTPGARLRAAANASAEDTAARDAAARTARDAEVRAARRGMGLLRDDRAELLSGLFTRDSRDAAAAVGEAP